MNEHTIMSQGPAADRVLLYPYEHAYPALETRERPAYPSMLGMVVALYILATIIFSQRETLSYLTQAMAVLAILFWAVWSISTGLQFAFPRPVVWYGLWFAWATVTMPICESGQPFNQDYMTIAKVSLITLVVSQCVRTRGDLLACLLVFAVTGILVFSFGSSEVLQAVNYQRYQSAAKTRANDTLLGNPNYLAFFALIAVVASIICFLVYRNKLLRLVSLFSIPFSLYLLMASGSRKGMSSIVLVAVSLYWFHFRKSWRGVSGKLASLALGIAIIAGSVVFVSKMPTVVRLTKTIGSSGQFEKEARFRWFLRGLEITAQHPVCGLGVGGFAIMGESGHFGTFSHSTITETLTGTGIPGFILYFGSQVSLFLQILRLRKARIPARDLTILNCCMCIFTVFVVYNVFAVMLGSKFGWPLLAAISGYCLQLQKDYAPRGSAMA